MTDEFASLAKRWWRPLVAVLLISLRAIGE